MGDECGGSWGGRRPVGQSFLVVLTAEGQSGWNTRQTAAPHSPAGLHPGWTDRREEHRRLTNRNDHSQHSHRQVLAQEEMLTPS